MLQNPVLEELGLSNYRNYIRAFNAQTSSFSVRQVGRRVALCVVNDLTASLGRLPTLPEVREQEKYLIERAEAEFPGQLLPPRPHGL